MRNWGLFFVLIILSCYALFGQQKQLLYDFDQIPQSLLLNPGGRADFKWFAGVPLLSGFSVQAGSSGISVYDIYADDGIDINQKIAEKAVYGMNIYDDLSGQMQLELLSGGFRSAKRPDTFYSFGMYLEGDAIGYWPQDLAILAWEGNANQYGRPFDLGHLKTRGALINVFHFGINRQLNRDWIIGARGKIYAGMIDANSTANSGFFETNPGQRNITVNTIEADMELRTSGAIRVLDLLRDDVANPGAEITNWLTKRALFGGDLGVGVDLGFTHFLSDQLSVTASLLDVGFIYHFSGTKNYQLIGQTRNEGLEIELPEDLTNTPEDFWQDLIDDISEVVPNTFDTRSYLTFRPTKLYSSIRYDFGLPEGGSEPCDCDYRTTAGNKSTRYRNSVGAQFFAINRPRGPQVALTGYYQRNLGNVLAVKTSYTVSKYSLSNIGLGLNLQAGPVNFYVMGDNLLPYFRNLADSHYASFQIGLNILSWEKN